MVIMDSKSKIREIIETASHRFAVYGYEETSINEICKACNISKGKFYYYFSDKEDLFTACCTHAYSLVNEIFNLFTFEPNITLKHNLLNLFICYQKIFSEHDFLLYIIYTIHSTQQITIKEKILEITNYHQKRFTNIIKDILKCFAINANEFDISLGFHTAFMAAYESQGVINLKDICKPTGNNSYDYFEYYIDKILFGVLPRDNDTFNNPKCAR